VKAGHLAVTAILIVILLSLPVYVHFGINQLENADVGSKSFWKTLATNAWEYFQPGKGVDATTGLHLASIGYPHFTEWDLGVYIQAIIDAQKLGILSSDGTWGADARIEKILTFLETREISPQNLPYYWYNSDTGLPWGNGAGEVYDAGMLLVSLSNLKQFKPDLAGRIDYVVYDRYNYSALFRAVERWTGSTNIYEYYITRGFASFWPEKFSNISELILDNIFSAPKVETPEGFGLPASYLTGDPLLYSVFELDSNSRVTDLANQFYLAHEAKYNATGEYVAFGEGNTGLDDPSYVFEWTVKDNRTWVVSDKTHDLNWLSPIAYFKVAVSFLALHNTEFAQNMVSFLEPKLLTSNGYMSGVDGDGRVVSTVVDKTNALIIAAARYAIETGNFTSFPWHNGDLSLFPKPFIQDGMVNDTTIVIGEGKVHDYVKSAPATDGIGGMLITEGLTRESSNGSIKAALDSWVINYDLGSGNVTFLDNSTNLIIVGNPEVNSLSYYYNNLTDDYGESLVPVKFIKNSDEGYNYLYVPASGSIYKLTFDEENNLVCDYGVIMTFQDQFTRNVVLVYGLAAKDTLGACQVLRNYANWNLRGSAVIIKMVPDTSGAFTSNSSIIETVY
jgi:hypothetical protein